MEGTLSGPAASELPGWQGGCSQRQGTGITAAQMPAYQATQPMSMILPQKDYGGRENQPLYTDRVRPAGKPITNYMWGGANMVKAIVNVMIPPLIFGYTISVTNFWLHFKMEQNVWALTTLGFLPALVALSVYIRAARLGSDRSWELLSVLLFLFAALAGSVIGDLNYWFFIHPFLSIETMKTYTNIDPADVPGSRLMDAGKVHFAENVRVATDMGMSYTSWDTYCVAPITTSAGLPSQGTNLAFYDLWAVGLNCCSPGQPNFHCGDYNNINARSGLRQVDESQRLYFRLAVEQAEAQYNIEAKHPLFFHWVQDPEYQLQQLFVTGFRNWLSANMVFFACNFVLVGFFMLFLNPKSRHNLDSLGVL